MLEKSTTFCHIKANTTLSRWTSAESSIKPHNRLPPSPAPYHHLRPSLSMWESAFSGTKEQSQSGFWSKGRHLQAQEGKHAEQHGLCPWARLPLPTQANTQELARVSHVLFLPSQTQSEVSHFINWKGGSGLLGFPRTAQ